MKSSAVSVLVLVACFAFAACDDEDDATKGGAMDGVADSGAPAATGSATSAVDSGSGPTTASDSGTPATECEQKDAPLPATTVSVDGVAYYLVLSSVLGDPGAFRKQLNFGTAEQFHKCPEEPGQNSTFALVLSFKAKPTTSGTFGFTSSRSVSDGEVNFYVTFFNKTGHARSPKNYVSPGAGTLALTITGPKATASVTALTMANEVDAGETFPLTAAFDLDW